MSCVLNPGTRGTLRFTVRASRHSPERTECSGHGSYHGRTENGAAVGEGRHGGDGLAGVLVGQMARAAEDSGDEGGEACAGEHEAQGAEGDGKGQDRREDHQQQACGYEKSQS